jgi:tetratricopeptide (TPR) repeat protein
MWLDVFVIVALVAVATWLAVRHTQVVGFAAALMIFPMIPVLAGIRVYDQGNMTHDRYLYLPSVGFCILLGLLAKWLISRPEAWVRPAASVVTGLICVVYGSITITQQKFYRNDEAFYQRAIDISPQNYLVIDYLGNVYLKENEFERAIDQYQKAQKIAPEDSNTRFFLARGLFKNQQYAAAEPLFEQLSTKFVDSQHYRNCAVLLSLATAEVHLGKLREAEGNLRRLLDLDSQYPETHRTMGVVFQREQRIADAQAEYAKEYQISGDQEAKRQAIALARYLMASRGDGSNPVDFK